MAELTSNETPAPAPAPAEPRGDAYAFASIAICVLIWGTTWYAITLQLGVVPPIISVIYRFALAAAVILAGCLLTGRSIRMTGAQHLASLGQGLLTFSFQYSLVYFAEQSVASAVVAVVFAAMAFFNLLLFKLIVGQKASGAAWVGSALGVVGVAILSIAELSRVGVGSAGLGIAASIVAMLLASLGNLFAWRNQMLGAAVIPATGWAMAYGTAFLTLYALVTGAPWLFEPTWEYALSLVYLSIFGSVIAFVIYFTLARSRGYALASYTGAMVPMVAMLISVLLEGADFGLTAFLGFGVVLLGQILLIRAPKKA